MEVVKVNDKKVISIAIKVIKNGGVVICPTDTVYGLIADATNKKAVDKIFKLKKRPRSKPLPIFVKDIKMAKELAYIDEPAFAKGFGEARQEKMLKSHWPGKHTFILKRKELLGVGDPTILWGINKKTIALRIPKCKFLNDLLKKINKPLVQTSVNISGQPPMTKIKEIAFLLKKCGTSEVPHFLIIDGGDLLKSKSSKVVDLTGSKPKTLRD